MDTLENYFANNYVESKNKDINKCIASAIKGNTDCNLEPVDNYLDINEKMFKQISVYKKSHEKLKQVMNKLHTCPLVTGTEKEAFKKGFIELAEPGSEIRFITLLLKYIDLIRAEHKIYKDKFISLKKQTYKGPYMNGGIFKSPDEKYLLGLIIAPLKEEHKDGYIALTNSIDMTKKSGIGYTSARKGDIIYGIGYKGKDFTLKNGITTEVSPPDNLVKKFFPLDGQETQPVQQNTTGKALAKTIDSFINIPKKNNGLMYVIFFILLFVLFRNLKK